MTTKSINRAKGLTPVYTVYYIRVNISGNNHFHTPETRHRDGTYHTVSLTEAKARRLVANLQQKGLPAKAYHYGWKERGFQSGEKACTPLCTNALHDSLAENQHLNKGSVGI